MHYNINDIYPCIQGEGVNTGIPMILIRMQGCAVGCPWCDTRETWNCPEENKVTLTEAMGTNARWTEVSAEELLAHINDLPQRIQWILLTGGEPAEQNLSLLVSRLKQTGYKVATETSGTATGHLEADFDWVCVSPKFDMPGGREVVPVCLERAHEIKLIVGEPAHIERLERTLKTVRLGNDATISLQPVSLSRKATELCIETVIRKGWRMSFQTHKFIKQR